MSKDPQHLVELTIKFSNLLAKKIGSTQKVVIDTLNDWISLSEFLNRIKTQSWSGEVLKDNHVASSIILVIDDQLIQFSNNDSDIKINESSEINFQMMFAGG